MIEWILEPLSYEFMVRAFIAALLVGVVCPLVGCYVVVRGLAFFGEALAHGVFPGVAIAYLLGSSILLGGLAAGVFIAIAIGLVSRRTNLDDQTSIGIVFPVAFAAGVLLLSRVPTFASDINHLLFGNLLGVSPTDLIITAVLALGVVAVLVILHRPLSSMTFDPVAAQLQGVPVAALQFGLLVLLALVVVIAIQTAGNLLVLSLLVTPAAAAWLFARSMSSMMVWAAVMGVISSVGGVLISFHLAVPVGPAVVVLAAAQFALVAAVVAIVRQVGARRALSGVRS